MRCSECCYYWVEEDGTYPSCQWESRAPGDLPPCEVDDYEDDCEDGE